MGNLSNPAMDAWLIALAIVVIVFLGWWILKRFEGPAESEFEDWARTCLEKQAMKRGGSVKMSGQTALLTTPYKNISIEVSKALVPGYEDNEYIYARFKSPLFADKSFKVIVDSDDEWLKPRFVAHRMEVADERFRGKYIVDASDGDFVNSVLSAEIRDRLLKRTVDVRFGKRVGHRLGEQGWLTVFTGAINEEAYDSLIEIAVIFYERFEVLEQERRVA
jgi:hypothetical protein